MTAPGDFPPSPDRGTASRPWRPSERVIAAIALVSTLLVGIVIGVTLDRTMLAPRGKFSRARMESMRTAMKDPDWGKKMRQKGRDRMVRELGLTTEQAARVDTIMARRSGAFKAARTEAEARARSMIDTTRMMIDSVLTPDQRVKFKAMHDRRKRDWRGRSGPNGPGDHPRSPQGRGDRPDGPLPEPPAD
jgi:Spy/CpxP family protein refolding chaperone